ncbi:MAG TPA: KEOPS complex subunit Cgi121 [Thermoplasmata archaeon]|nr:KEOPS complex subunit Cgi121 [Thermoplasmata archaeon]HUI37995.1 KEOPS complex subunit Cgi121 [Thermoplasmata archaeon]
MTPLPPAESRPLWAVGARRAVPGNPSLSDLVARLRKLSASAEPLVALLDARGVVGERHLLSAWAHLGRSRARGETRLRDRGAEFLLFVAGDDQLPRALAKVGVASDTERFVLVGERPREPGPLLGEFGLVEDADAYPRAAGAEALDRLGISEEERRPMPPDAWEGLVLERVALLELSAAHGAPGGPETGKGAPGPGRPVERKA